MDEMLKTESKCKMSNLTNSSIIPDIFAISRISLKYRLLNIIIMIFLTKETDELN
jgi:hypothetical protein